MYPTQGDSSHHPEPNGSTSWTGAGPVSRLAEDLALTLGCPVEVSYREDTREVIAVARPEGGGEVRVSLTVSPSRCSATVTVPPSRLNFAPFDTRFHTT